MSSIKLKIKMLEIYKDNLNSADTLEEYKQAHSLWIDYLINLYIADEALEKASLNFIDTSENFQNKMSSKNDK